MAIQWVPTTEARYDEMLGVLPPAAQGGDKENFAFQVGEAMTHRNGRPTFDTYTERNGEFFVSAEDLTFAEFKAEFPNAVYYYSD